MQDAFKFWYEKLNALEIGDELPIGDTPIQSIYSAKRRIAKDEEKADVDEKKVFTLRTHPVNNSKYVIRLNNKSVI